MVLHTLQVEHTCLLVVYTLLSVINTRFQKGMRGVKLFVLYSALALVGALAVAMRGSLPDFLSIVGGNVDVLAAYTALYGSMHRLFRFGRLQRRLAALWLCVGIATMVWLGMWHPVTGPRLVAFSMVLALQQVHLAGLLLFGPAERRRASWTLALFLIALCTANVFRIFTVLVHGAPADYRAAGPALAGVVLANACFQCGLMVAYIWMTAARLRGDLEVLANTDPLTGLLNRRAMDAAAAKYMGAAEAANGCSALLLDLDSYKPINDRLGHAAGDQALVAVAQLLRRKLDPDVLVARTGGDEFMALLPGSGAEQTAMLAEQLRMSLETLDLGLSEADVRVTGSFGVAESFGGESWDELCSHCDQSMYTIKEQGGNGVHCYNPRNASSALDIFMALS